MAPTCFGPSWTIIREHTAVSFLALLKQAFVYIIWRTSFCTSQITHSVQFRVALIVELLISWTLSSFVQNIN